MRSVKLTSAVAAAATLLALAPAGAAARHDGGGGGCRINLNLAPQSVTTGEASSAFGRLACVGHVSQPVAGQTVTLFERPTTSVSYTAVGTGTTDAGGFYLIATPTVTVNTKFYVSVGGLQSGRKLVRAAPQVTLTGPPEGTQLFTGPKTRVTFTGTVNPALVNAIVVLQRENALTGNDWHRIDLGHVHPGGVFSITHTFLAPGDANLRVIVRGGRRNLPGASNVLTYEISQTQNPSLTIHSSADPIPFGGSTTISGVVNGAATGTAVKLLAHTAGGLFTQVAETKTEAGGAYSFAPQSPAASTFYRVQSAGKSSAVLYEGVKYVLTASASATTIEAGQSVTFSGSVLPVHAGHVIYLERSNFSGTSFHVVQVVPEEATGNYTIAHAIFQLGTNVFRVKIPGDPQNGGTASPTFTITVKPPIALSKLVPEPPGNESSPPEGQH